MEQETKTVADHSLMDTHFKAACNYLEARSILANRIIRSEDTEEIRVLTNIYLSYNESIKEILGL